MKKEKITFTKTFQTGISQWEKSGIEASLDENDNPIECLEQLKKEVEQFHKLSNPQLYKNGNEAIIHGFEMEEKVINRAYERVEVEMDRCNTVEELASYKDFANKNPDLMPKYMSKLKELTQKNTV